MRRKLSQFRHVCRRDTLPKTTLHVVVADGDRVVSHRGTASRSERASHCRHYCAMHTTEADGQPSQQPSVEVPKRRSSVTRVSQLVVWSKCGKPPVSSRLVHRMAVSVAAYVVLRS